MQWNIPLTCLCWQTVPREFMRGTQLGKNGHYLAARFANFRKKPSVQQLRNDPAGPAARDNHIELQLGHNRSRTHSDTIRSLSNVVRNQSNSVRSLRSAPATLSRQA